jgi:hypothetical protein
MHKKEEKCMEHERMRLHGSRCCRCENSIELGPNKRGNVCITNTDACSLIIVAMEKQQVLLIDLCVRAWHACMWVPGCMWPCFSTMQYLCNIL